MRLDDLKKFFIPSGPVLTVTMMGLLLLGALLYYRAVKFQRFIEPALAISQPTSEFSYNISRLFLSEFGGANLKGIRIIGDSIYVEKSLLAGGIHGSEESLVLKKIARVLLSIFKDPELNPHIDMILVNTMIPISDNPEVNRERRNSMLERSGLLLNALFQLEPELDTGYSRYLAPSVMAVTPEDKANWVEFRIIHSQRLHIDVFNQLKKYMP